MKNNIFDLTTEELNKIATSLKEKIEEGLKKENREIAAIPTYINPPKDIPDGKVLALDWGGNNFRAAVVEFKGGVPTVLGEPATKLLDDKATDGFNRDDLFQEMAATIVELGDVLDSSVTRIGFCFSYETASRLNGDAVVLKFAKGIDIPDMINKPLGRPFVNYLNKYQGINTEFTDIKVINDTVASLFAGLDSTGYDSYIGLIVGTGNNMAVQMRLDKIDKLNNPGSTGTIPINLESGNFNPPYLTVIDGLVDAMSSNRDFHRFEKAVSGKYISELFKTVFMCEKIKHDFDGGDLADMVNNPQKYDPEQAKVAGWIYERSAKLVAASVVGLAQVIVGQNPQAKKICLAAEGSVFWGKDGKGGTPYRDIVARELETLLPKGVAVTIHAEIKKANLIGAAISALSPSGKIVFD